VASLGIVRHLGASWYWADRYRLACCWKWCLMTALFAGWILVPSWTRGSCAAGTFLAVVTGLVRTAACYLAWMDISGAPELFYDAIHRWVAQRE